MIGGHAFELKVGKKDRIAFSSIPEHQISALLQVEEEGLAYKISDSAIGYKPFDCFYLGEGCRAWMILGFEGGKEVYMVPSGEVEDLIYNEHGERRKGSITKQWAEEHGRVVHI